MLTRLKGKLDEIFLQVLMLINKLIFFSCFSAHCMRHYVQFWTSQFPLVDHCVKVLVIVRRSWTPSTSCGQKTWNVQDSPRMVPTSCAYRTIHQQRTSKIPSVLQFQYYRRAIERPTMGWPTTKATPPVILIVQSVSFALFSLKPHMLWDMS